MSRTETVKGVLKTFFWLTKDELGGMDHKLFRIVFGIVGFLIITSFWFFLYRSFGVV
ncbi:MAG: hypothetical protein HYT72_01770 [Candidatus Aenigmarchaeota archaeon]|nr:hypothetical protein [Candidatus Aenigmarchaeota archaeon]